jgi:hypothetical protein
MWLPHSQRERPMSSSIYLHLTQARKACWTISSVICLLFTTIMASEARPQEASISIRGEVKEEWSLSLSDIKTMPPFLIRDIPMIPERVRDRKDEERVSQTTFRGVLLRDLLYKAGMKFKRKCPCPPIHQPIYEMAHP